MAETGSVRVILARKYLDGKEAVRRLLDGEVLITDTGRRVYFDDSYFLTDGTLYEEHKPEEFKGPFNNFVDLRKGVSGDIF